MRNAVALLIPVRSTMSRSRSEMIVLLQCSEDPACPGHRLGLAARRGFYVFGCLPQIHPRCFIKQNKCNNHIPLRYWLHVCNLIKILAIGDSKVRLVKQGIFRKENSCQLKPRGNTCPAGDIHYIPKRLAYISMPRGNAVGGSEFEEG